MGYGVSIALAVGMFTNPVAAVTAAILAGAVKEVVIDGLFKWGNPDKWDFAATALGGLAAGLLFIANVVIKQ